MIPARARRTLVTTLSILVFLVLAGATYQGVATALERRRFRHPGQLIDVGGHQLHIYCTGEGRPTVLLEAPAAGMSAAWGWVQPAVATVTRVCSYDRAGLGWSEAGDRRFEAGQVAEQLHTLVQRANEPAPYVVAGQGLGAAFATLYAARFGAEIAALVLVDPPSAAEHEGQSSRLTRLVNLSPWLARAGVLRAARLLSDSAVGLPEPSAGSLGAFLNRPDHLTRAARELAQWDDLARQAAAAPIGGGLEVLRVEAVGGARVAFLTDRRRAEAVSNAIAQAVIQTRAVAAGHAQ